MKRSVKWTLIVAAILAAVLAAGSIAVGDYFCNFAFRRMDMFDMSLLPPTGDTPEDIHRVTTIKSNRRAFNDLIAEWYPEQEIEHLRIESADGLGIAAQLIHADVPTHRYAILCHGYQGRGDNMVPHAYVFHEWGVKPLHLNFSVIDGASH